MNSPVLQLGDHRLTSPSPCPSTAEPSTGRGSIINPRAKARGYSFKIINPKFNIQNSKLFHRPLLGVFELRIRKISGVCQQEQEND